MSSNAFGNRQALSDNIPTKAILRNNQKQNTLERMASYPYHTYMILITLMQLLNIGMCFVYINNIDRILSIIGAIFVYLLLVLLSVALSGVMVSRTNQKKVSLIKEDCSKNRILVPELTIELLKWYKKRNSWRHQNYGCTNYELGRMQVKTSNVYDNSGPLNVNNNFTKRYVQVFTILDTQILHEIEQKFIKMTYNEWLQREIHPSFSYNKQKDIDYHFEWTYDGSQVSQQNYFKQYYMNGEPHKSLLFIAIFSAILIISYPVYFIIDKIFIERYTVRLQKKSRSMRLPTQCCSIFSKNDFNDLINFYVIKNILITSFSI